MLLLIITTLISITTFTNAVQVNLDHDARQELIRYITTLDDHYFYNVSSIQQIPVSRVRLARLTGNLQRLISRYYYQSPYWFAIKPLNLTLTRSLATIWIYSRLIGQTLVQDYTGSHLYQVYDIGRRMGQGGRYSQSNQGRNFHTDGVNVADGYDIFLLMAVSKPQSGGDSVVINGDTVFNRLNATPRGRYVLRQLQRNFTWEWKGVKRGVYYQAPILRGHAAPFEPPAFQKGGMLPPSTPLLFQNSSVQRQLINEVVVASRGAMQGPGLCPRGGCNPPIQWRYLRSYLEESAQRQGGFTRQQSRCLDILDSILENPANQHHFTLTPGSVAFINDRRVFHGRTSFIDYPNAVSLEQYLADQVPGPVQLKRTMLRTWINFG